MFICTDAFIYHMYQSKGELHTNDKLHFLWICGSKGMDLGQNSVPREGRGFPVPS